MSCVRKVKVRTEGELNKHFGWDDQKSSYINLSTMTWMTENLLKHRRQDALRGNRSPCLSMTNLIEHWSSHTSSYLSRTVWTAAVAGCNSVQLLHPSSPGVSGFLSPSQPSLRPTSLAPLCSLVWFCVLLVWCRHSYIPLPNFPLVKKELCMWFKVSKINMPRYMCALCVYAYVWLGDSMCLTHHRPSVVVRLCLRSYLRQVRSACGRAASVRWETRCWRHSSPSGLSSWPLTDHTHIHTHTYPPTHTLSRRNFGQTFWNFAAICPNDCLVPAGCRRRWFWLIVAVCDRSAAFSPSSFSEVSNLWRQKKGFFFACGV